MSVQHDLHSIHITHRLTLLSIWLLEGNTPSVLEDDITAARNILNYTEIVAFDEILREITIITALTGFARKTLTTWFTMGALFNYYL